MTGVVIFSFALFSAVELVVALGTELEQGLSFSFGLVGHAGNPTAQQRRTLPADSLELIVIHQLFIQYHFILCAFLW